MGDVDRRYYLSGTYTPRLDSKGRLTIPSSLRKELGDEVAILMNDDYRCLEVLPWPAFTSLMDKFYAAREPFDTDTDDFRQVYLGDAKQAVIDNQGRVLIPPEMRDFAQLGAGEVVVTGDLDRLKVWNQDTWEARRRAVWARKEELKRHVREKFQLKAL